MKVEKTDIRELPDMPEPQIKPDTEDVPMYQGLQESTQTFHAIARFDVRDDLVILRTPDKLKRINDRKYRDQIFTLHEAIPKYINMGQVVMKLRHYGVHGADELKDLLDDFGAKIYEAIGNLDSMHKPITPQILAFKHRYEEYTRAKLELMSTDKLMDIL